MLPSVPTPSYEFSVNNQSVGEGLNLGELSGRTVKILSVKVKNNSPKTGQMSSISFSNPKFLVMGNQCVNVVLKPHQSCVAKVVVQGDNTNSELTTSVAFDGQNGSLSAQQVEQVLNGNMISISSAVTLGDFFQEGVNKIQLLKIENLGSGVGSIENIDLPPGYSLGSNNCINIKPKNSCIIRLVYHSEDLVKGSHTDSVQIGDGSVDLTVNQVSNPNSLSSVEISEIPDEFLVVDCVPVKLVVKDNEGLDFVSSGSLELSASLGLFSDNSCTESATLTLSPFESELLGYYKTSEVGSKTLTVSVNSVSGNKNFTVYSVLGITPESSAITLSNNQVFSGVGGKSPYTYEIVSGVGSLNGNIYSSNVAGAAQIKVTDGLGQIKETSITVNSNLVLTAGNCSYDVPESVGCTVVSSGGVGTKTYSVDVGAIDQDSGLFVGECVNNLGSSVVTVTDQYGNSQDLNLTYPCVYKSCSEVIAKGYSTVSGNFWIDPDGLTPTISPELLYCEFDGNGAWTLTTRLNTNDGGMRSFGDTNFWEGSGVGTLSGVNDYMAPYFANNSGFREIRLKYTYGVSASDTTVESIYRKADNTNSLKQNLLLNLSNANPTWSRVFTGSGDSSVFFGNSLIFKTIGNGVAGNLNAGGADFSRIWYNFTAVSACNQGGSIGHHGDYNSNNWQWEVARGSSLDPAGCQFNAYKLQLGNDWAQGSNNSLGKTLVSPTAMYTNGIMRIFTKDTYYHHAKSCKDALANNIPNQAGNMNSGYWTIDPDGYGYGNAPITVYCNQDVSLAGGGWTLVAFNNGVSGTGAIGTDFFVAVKNQAAMSNISAANTASSLNLENMSAVLNSTDIMMIAPSYGAGLSPLIETGIGQWNYNSTKCGGTFRRTSRTAGCAGQNANDNFDGADRFNISFNNGNQGIVPTWLMLGNELCYSGKGWCTFQIYLR